MFDHDWAVEHLSTHVHPQASARWAEAMEHLEAARASLAVSGANTALAEVAGLRDRMHRAVVDAVVARATRVAVGQCTERRLL